MNDLKSICYGVSSCTSTWFPQKNPTCDRILEEVHFSGGHQARLVPREQSSPVDWPSQSRHRPAWWVLTCSLTERFKSILVVWMSKNGHHSIHLAITLSGDLKGQSVGCLEQSLEKQLHRRPWWVLASGSEQTTHFNNIPITFWFWQISLQRIIVCL